MRDVPAHVVEDGEVAVAAVGAAHRLQHRVRAGLQRHVQARHHVRRVAHRLDHVVGEVPRVRRGEPDPLQPLDRTAGAQQLAERELVAELGAVGVHVLAEQGHLDDPVGDEGLTSSRMSPGRRSRSRPRSDGTMQKVQVLLQPTEMDTQPEYADWRRAGSSDGNVVRVSSNSACASWRSRARSSSLGRAPMLCVP